ncbi:MAG: hypothetical protein ACLSDQ_11845 [Adlercreutzia equolifaciens]
MGGALYRVMFEDGPTDPDDPRMGELASWKPTARYWRVLRRRFVEAPCGTGE